MGHHLHLSYLLDQPTINERPPGKGQQPALFLIRLPNPNSWFGSDGKTNNRCPPYTKKLFVWLRW